MSTSARTFRLSKFSKEKVNLLLPVDHGLTHGPMQGITPVSSIVDHLKFTKPQGIIAHRGILKKLMFNKAITPETGVILHLNGNLCSPATIDTKIELTSVEAAMFNAADAVSLQLNFNESNISENISLLGKIGEKTHRCSLPLLVMIYSNRQQDGENEIEKVRHLIRVCIELGVDMVKIALPKSVNDTESILKNLTEDIHIYFAGGATSDYSTLSDIMEPAIELGAKGFCVGRNIFQNPKSKNFIEKIAKLNS